MQTMSALEAHDMLMSGNAIFFDIRSENEFKEAHLPGSALLPLDMLDEQLPKSIGEKDAVFYCTSGARTRNGWSKIAAAGFENVKVLEGGINSWISSGLPTISKSSGSVKMSVVRQVQILVGLLIVLCAGLAMSGISEAAYALLAIGLGLLLAGVTGSCLMAQVLMAMPWNRT